jgi:hypothetical protein
MMSTLFVTAAVLVIAQPDVPSSKQVHVSVRVCQGDPKGSVEAGTMEVISRPTMSTIKDRPASVRAGQEFPVVRDGNVEYVLRGFMVQVTPRSIDRRVVEVEVEFEDSSRKDAPKLRAAMSGRFLRGDPVRLFLPTPEGEPRMWAEIIVDKATR